MAKTTDSKGSPLFLRSPRQASKSFGLDQYIFGGASNGAVAGVPRPKFLFMVRFVRGVGTGGIQWRDGLTMAVKRFDRPTISPVVQEVNQYNKKRLVQTGIKYGSVTVDFHDTVDTAVSALWQEYSAYHFGDMRKTTDNDWGYDIVSGNGGFLNAGEGFGFALPPGSNAASALSSSFFFSKIECYQLYGGSFTQFDLIHPKITSYNPDELDYENPGSNSIRMTMEFESIVTRNQGAPMRISQDATVASILGVNLDGDVYEPAGNNTSSVWNQGSVINGKSTDSSGMLNSLFGGLTGSSTGTTSLLGSTSNYLGSGVLGGALGGMGALDFGSTGLGTQRLLASVIGGDLAGAGKSLANTVLGSGAVNLFQNPKSAITGIAYDLARGKAGANALNGQATPAMTAAFASVASSGGNVVGALNASRAPTAQVGYRVVDSSPTTYNPGDF